MNLSNIKPAEGSVKNRKRIARGQGSGHGGTATRGHKGQKSRSGYSKKVGFEGGQMPIQRRIPKFGFKNINRVEYRAVNLKDLQSLSEKLGTSEISLGTLVENGFATKNELVKILGGGAVSAKLSVQAHAFSKKAAEMIEAQGGSIEKI